MRISSLPRVALIVVAIGSLVACNAGTPATTQPPASAGATARPSVAEPTASAVAVDAIPKAWLLVGHKGASELHLVMSATGEIEQMAVPDGTPAAAWRRVVTATIDGGSTVVRDAIVQPGGGGPELSVDGRWQLPTIGLDPVPVGRSLDGSTIVLVQQPDGAKAGRSRFAVVQHWLMDSVQTAGDSPLRLARIVDLPGAFEYDTMSPDGSILYLVQHLDAAAGGHYQVRAVDVATGALRDGVIVDKANPDEWMAGAPIAQLRQPGGSVLTLYDGPEHPFIHALNSVEAWALCIDLPATGADPGTAWRDWGLTASPDGSSIYAVNATLGMAVDVDPSQYAVRRSASIGTRADAPIVLAKFGHGDVGPVGRRLVVTPDGKQLFAASGSGLLAIRTHDLTVARRDLAVAIDAVGITPDGATVFALTREGLIVGIDAATGQRLGTVRGDGFDRLLAVTPW